MGEYVSRQDVIATIRENGVYGSGYSNEEREDNVVDMIESVPAADVRPVVLCRDCVKYKTKYCAIDIWHVDATIFKARDTDFCSYGERNDEN